MNSFHPDYLLAIAKRKSQADVEWCLTESVLSRKAKHRWLVALGVWMVASGEKLQSLQSVSLQTNLTISQNKTSKARV